MANKDADRCIQSRVRGDTSNKERSSLSQYISDQNERTPNEVRERQKDFKEEEGMKNRNHLHSIVKPI